MKKPTAKVSAGSTSIEFDQTYFYPTGGGLTQLTTTVCGNPVGTAYGPKDSLGYVLVKFDLCGVLVVV